MASKILTDKIKEELKRGKEIKEQIKTLLNDKVNWKIFEQLVKENELQHISFADFSGADLSNATLDRANLQYARMFNTKLPKSK